MLAIQMVGNLTAVLRLGYCLPEADFAALLDRIYRQTTQTVLEALPR